MPNVALAGDKPEWIQFTGKGCPLTILQSYWLETILLIAKTRSLGHTSCTGVHSKFRGLNVKFEVYEHPKPSFGVCAIMMLTLQARLYVYQGIVFLRASRLITILPALDATAGAALSSVAKASQITVIIARVI